MVTPSPHTPSPTPSSSPPAPSEVDEQLPASYPAGWEVHAVLADGAAVEIRPIRPADRSLVAAFHSRQSAESIYFRFFRHRPELSDRELEYFTNIDYERRMAFVALVGGELVGVARYEGMGPKEEPVTEAEVAFFIDDGNHGRGLATLLLEYLAAAARSRGIIRFSASVLPENYAMLAVFRRAGFDVTTAFDDGTIQVGFGIEVTDTSVSAVASRHQMARSRSVRHLLEPESIILLGASRFAGEPGHELARSLVESSRPVALVNPATTSLFGRVVHPDLPAAVDALDAPADLAIVALPAAQVEEAALECGRLGVRSLLVVASEFAEVGPEGEERQRRLVNLARNQGMRLAGPNGFGLVNGSRDSGFVALVHPVPTPLGHVGVVSDSGPLGAAVMDRLGRVGVGVSSFVGIGNQADIGVNDLLDYWSLDSATKVVVLYAEQFGELDDFLETVRRTSLAKPVVALAPAEAEQADLFAQHGVILVDQVSELAEQAGLACDQPVPRGERTVIVSNTASLARLAASACRRFGLDVVVPDSAATGAAERASGRVPERVGEGSVLVGNLDAVSLPPETEFAHFERVVVACAVSDQVDSVMLALAPTRQLPVEELAELFGRVNRAIDKPMVAVGLVDPESLEVPGLPVFSFPDEAARALSRWAAYGRWRTLAAAQPAGEDGRFGPLAELIDDLGGDAIELTLADATMAEWVEALDLVVAASAPVLNEGELADAGERLGYPVVLKAAPEPRSIGEAGGIAIDLYDHDDLVAAYRRMKQRFGASMDPAIVQTMVDARWVGQIELVSGDAGGAYLAIGPRATAGRVPHLERRYLPLSDHDMKALAERFLRLAGQAPLSASDQRHVQTMLQSLASLNTSRVGTVSLSVAVGVAGSPTPTVLDIRISLEAASIDPLDEIRHL